VFQRRGPFTNARHRGLKIPRVKGDAERNHRGGSEVPRERTSVCQARRCRDRCWKSWTNIPKRMAGSRASPCLIGLVDARS
jgi:hypothetical protein